MKKEITDLFKNSEISESQNYSNIKINDSDCIILPGVGSFSHGSNKLRKKKLDKIIYDNFKKGKPIIGICLGFQLLFDKGTEFKNSKGLGILKGDVKELPKSIKFPLPHIGWNKLIDFKGNSKNLFNKNNYYYFVHSYYVDPKKKYNFLGITQYGKFKFCSAVIDKNVFGFQFHPEKSGNSGLILLNKILNNAKKI